jgi:hypothetical protein
MIFVGAFTENPNDASCAGGNQYQQDRNVTSTKTRTTRCFTGLVFTPGLIGDREPTRPR